MLFNAYHHFYDGAKKDLSSNVYNNTKILVRPLRNSKKQNYAAPFSDLF